MTATKESIARYLCKEQTLGMTPLPPQLYQLSVDGHMESTKESDNDAEESDDGKLIIWCAEGELL